MIFMWFASDHDITLKPLELYTSYNYSRYKYTQYEQ